VRQVDAVHRPLLAAIEVDSIYVPTDLIAREVLARIVYPEFWTFIEEAVQCDDAWAESTRDRLLERMGREVPEHKLITLDAHEAPAVVRWLADRGLSVGDLCRHPDVREGVLPVGVLMLKRGEELVLTPDPDTPLQVGDQLLFAGTGISGMIVA